MNDDKKDDNNEHIINDIINFIFTNINYNFYFLYELEKIMYSNDEKYNDIIRDYICLIYNKIKEFTYNENFNNCIEVYKKYVKYYLKLIFRENKENGLQIGNIIMKNY